MQRVEERPNRVAGDALTCGSQVDTCMMYLDGGIDEEQLEGSLHTLHPLMEFRWDIFPLPLTL